MTLTALFRGGRKGTSLLPGSDILWPLPSFAIDIVLWLRAGLPLSGWCHAVILRMDGVLATMLGPSPADRSDRHHALPYSGSQSHPLCRQPDCCGQPLGNRNTIVMFLSYHCCWLKSCHRSSLQSSSVASYRPSIAEYPPAP